MGTFPGVMVEGERAGVYNRGVFSSYCWMIYEYSSDGDDMDDLIEFLEPVTAHGSIFTNDLPVSNWIEVS